MLGSNADARKTAGAATRVLDLGGRMAMPGLIDAHCHPTKGAIADLFSCKLAFDDGPADIARRLSDRITADPDAEWIIVLFLVDARRFLGSNEATNL